MNSFTTVIYTFKVSKHIIIGQSTNINVFSWLLSFFKLRERESGIQNLGIKEKWPQSYLSYFSTGFHWRIFLLSRANRLCFIFLHWLEEPGVLCVSVILLSSTRSKMAMVRLPAMDPAQKLTFLLSISADGGGALQFWGPSQSFGFSLPPLPVSGDLRLLSTNTCWYPSVTYIPPLRSLFWRLGTVNFKGRIVILSPSSQWDITWHTSR